MVYSLILDRFAAPYEIDRALTFDAGVRNILITLDTVKEDAPVAYFSFRPFLWFNPGVAGLGFTDFYLYHDTIYRARQAYRLNFPERWGLEVMRLPGGSPQLMRIRAYYE